MENINIVLDVGSSDLTFRTKIQPFIEENIFVPLNEHGCKVYHLDAKCSEGVDIVMDATELYRLDLVFDLVLCFNLLEHVSDIAKVVFGLGKVIRNGGYLLLTVPKKYPYHPDPIDNFFRPDCRTLENIFKYVNLNSIFYKTIIVENMEIKQRLMSVIKYIRNRKVLYFNLKQLAGNFEVSLILLRKCFL